LVYTIFFKYPALLKKVIDLQYQTLMVVQICMLW